MSNWVYKHENFVMPPSRRISSWNLQNLEISKEEWVKQVLNHLPYHICIRGTKPKNIKDFIHFDQRRWIDKNCSGYWTNSSLISHSLIQQNNLKEFGQEYKNSDDFNIKTMLGLTNLFGLVQYYCFELEDDAIIFRLYAEG